MPIKVYTATKGDDVVGYAVESMTKDGFGGVIRMMVGFTADGKINNVNVLEQAETPGLGTKMCDQDNALLSSIQGRNSWEVEFKVKKDGGELDALTAATISSRAYYNAVARAYQAFAVAVGAKASADGVSGATTTDSASKESNAAQEGGKNE
jgi:electron transport complex protein RnfG